MYNLFIYLFNYIYIYIYIPMITPPTSPAGFLTFLMSDDGEVQYQKGKKARV